MKYRTLFLFAISGLFMLASLQAQDDLVGWQHHGLTGKFSNGIRTSEWYAKSPAPSAAKVIVVAVLDSGIDTEHPDLKPNIWVNPGEIPGNGIDDDGNGYTDDIHGWNFIGGPDGRSIVQETYEVTRLYAKGKAKWLSVDEKSLKGRKKKEYDAFLEMKEKVESELEKALEEIVQVEAIESLVMTALQAAQKELKGDSLDLARLERSSGEEVKTAARIIRNVEDQGVKVESIEWLMEIAAEQFTMQKEESEKAVRYHYNPDYDSREIVGDVYEDFGNRYYGNNDVAGEFSYHGTHVAGIIGAVRENGMGVDGVVDRVAIMSLRIVPDGDEHDKDVANAIYYAVDNGARVINMSSGKGYSPEKFLVDKALKYGAKHDVLFVFSAGNDGKNIDKTPKYPNGIYLKKPLLGPKRAPNLLSVGALSPEGGEQSVAEFSNYGKKDVGVFAPGEYIYSTTPGGAYGYADGTSFAAPVVSGVAALILSRYPALSAVQVKDIIIKSSRPLPAKVTQPGTFETVGGAELGAGGIIDVVAAMQLSAKTKGKAKPGRRKADNTYASRSGKA